ncbi:hypothetical protein LCGC14_3166750 [marine sediment metagenome]|uniref:Uncharacterized protein n=1 Tax=marine sediment metagenome TaxID=412755 RepID=A0A0F8XRI7_9ZZZZ
MKDEVTIRIKMGGYELEVTGSKEWAERMIRNFVRRQRAAAKRKETKGDE